MTYNLHSSMLSHKLNGGCSTNRELRIEFDHSQCDYYPGIDAVLLKGWPSDMDSSCSPRQLNILKSYTPKLSVDVAQTFQTFLQDKKGYKKYLQVCQSQDIGESEDTYVAMASSNFESLPEEIISKIFGYCDLHSLCQLSQVNHRFNNLSHDSLLISELDLKDYWWGYESALRWALHRCERIRKLDVSWVFSDDSIPFLRFMFHHGKTLTHLRLDSSRFVHKPVVETIFDTCSELRELSLQRCGALAVSNITSRLYHLERLNLYHSTIRYDALLTLLLENPGLQHLNLGSCDFEDRYQVSQIGFLDRLMNVLSTHNKRLVTLDLWKSGQMGEMGLQAFSELRELQEVDLGWCVQLLEPSNHFMTLARSCRKLRKVFLGACRALTEQDLISLTQHCPLLEQVDLMGIQTVTPAACLEGVQKQTVKSEPDLLDPLSIQGLLEIALQRFKPSNNPQVVISSRTDQGVHALRSAVHVDLTSLDKALAPSFILYGLNRYFEKAKADVRVHSCQYVPDTFHARYSAKSRTYLYRFAVRHKGVTDGLTNSKYVFETPITEKNRCHFIFDSSFNVEKVQEAVLLFPGIHDFRTFMGSSCNQFHDIRTIRQINSLTFEPGRPMLSSEYHPCVDNFTFYDVKINARSFLYRQVRRTVGALIAVAQDRLTVDQVKFMLDNPSRDSWNPRAVVVPPHGLYLVNVEYDSADLQVSE